MKKVGLIVLLAVFLYVGLKVLNRPDKAEEYDVYQYVQQCKTELGIKQPLPQLSCLDGKQVPIYVNHLKIDSSNWEELAGNKKCDNPHWLGGDMGCWTYSHLQVINLGQDNVLVLNCRQKGNQSNKDWFRASTANLGLDKQQRQVKFEKASAIDRKELYYLYNTFNDIGLILRNTKTGKSCYLTQYGKAVVGFLPPIDSPLPEKDKFFDQITSEHSRPPKNFPVSLWYRDANEAFRSPAFTADAGCIDCHNAHGFKYSPYINSNSGIPSIYAMAELPMLLVAKPFQQHFYDKNFLQVTTDSIDGEDQLCTQCHKMTTSGTCGPSIDYATGHPHNILHKWLTAGTNSNWMPPRKVDLPVLKKHLAAIKCCCENPDSQGCSYRRFGPTEKDLPEGFSEGKGWIEGNKKKLCAEIINSYQWNADKF